MSCWELRAIAIPTAVGPVAVREPAIAVAPETVFASAAIAVVAAGPGLEAGRMAMVESARKRSHYPLAQAVLAAASVSESREAKWAEDPVSPRTAADR